MLSDEEAKAIQEASKLGQKAIDSTADATSFLVKTFGPAIDQFSKALEDKADGYRIRNRARVISKTRDYLETLGITDLNSVGIRNGILFLEAVSE